MYVGPPDTRHYFYMLKITNTEARQNFEFTLTQSNVDLWKEYYNKKFKVTGWRMKHKQTN